MKTGWTEWVSEKTTQWASSSAGLFAALLITAVFFLSVGFLGWGRAWNYTEAWISIVSFVMLFLLQRSQTKDNLALQIKLNELLAAVHKASPRLINIEDQGEEQVRQLHDRFQELQESDAESHSITEAAEQDCDDLLPPRSDPARRARRRTLP